MIGKTIGQYEITAALGKGGMGVVYQATDTKIDRTVALKFLPEDLTRDEEAKIRFLREARTAGQLDHPNVCTIHDIAETDAGQMYLVMACYPGGSLEERMKAGGLGQDESLEIIGQIAAGLDAAHAAGIVHRDIKPGNILFSADGLVKIVDFGLAKLGDQTKVTQTGTTLGTGSYMAPEQASGEEAGPAADIWSLAVVAYEMLTGERPFQGDFLPAVVYAIVHTEPEQPSHLNSGLSPSIDAALLKGLVKNPEDRFARATELWEGLTGQRVVSTRGTPRALRPPVAEKTLVVRRTFLQRLGLVLLAAAVVLAGYVGWNRLQDDGPLSPLPHGPDRSRTLAILPFSYQGDEAHQELAGQVRRLLADRLGFKGDLYLVAGDSLEAYLTEGEKEGWQGESLSRTTRRLEADLVLGGKVIVIGDGLQVVLKVETAEGKAGTVNGQIYPVGEILDYADRLALKSIRFFYPDPWAELIRMQATISENWEALSYFIGAEMDRRYAAFGPWNEDINASLQSDSTSALAHFNKVHLALWGEDERLTLAEARAAQRHAEALPQEGQDLIEAMNLFLDNEMDQAENILNRTLLTRPEFLDAWLALGYIGWDSNPLRGRNLLETMPAFEQAANLDPQNRAIQIYRVFLWTLSGNYQALEKYFTRPGGRGIAPQDQALLAFLTDDFARQEALVDSLDLSSIYIQQAIVLNWPDNYQSKLRYLQHLHDNIDNPLLKGWAREIMAQTRAGLGQWKQARADFAALPAKQQPWRLTYEALLMAMPFTECPPEEIQEQIAKLKAWRPRANASLEEDAFGLVGSRYNPDFALHPHMKEFALGMLQMRLGDQAAARAALGRFRALTVETRSRPMIKELELSLEGWIAYRAGDAQATLDILADAAQYTLTDMGYSGLHDRPFQRYLRALALADVGRLDEAIPWLVNIDQKSERNMAYVVPAYRRLGEIHAQRGDPASALKYFEKFLFWYQDCDDRYRSQVEEVEAKAAGLTAG